MTPINDRKSPSVLQLVFAGLGTAVVLVLAGRTLFSDRVSVEGEIEFRKGVERRLEGLEEQDKALGRRLEQHMTEDSVAIGKLNDRLRDVELTIAKMGTPLRPSDWRKKIIFRPDTDGIVVQLSPRRDLRTNAR